MNRNIFQPKKNIFARLYLVEGLEVVRKILTLNYTYVSVGY